MSNDWNVVNEDPPLLFTGAEWTGMAIADRLELVMQHGVSDEIILADDVTKALPAPSRLYIERWQRLINAGDIFNMEGALGRFANSLIQRGFCLLARQQTRTTYFGPMPGRLDVAPGSPGSPGYIKALMGQEYLAWIEAVE